MRALQIDTRQQSGKHGAKESHFANSGVAFFRSKLYVGDYMYVGGLVSVDTKKDIAEAWSCLTSSHARFRAECRKAADAGIGLVILVENEHGIGSLAELSRWAEPESARRKRSAGAAPISGARMAKMIATMYRRYAVRWAFCSPEDAGAKVLELLDEYEEEVRDGRWFSHIGKGGE